MAIHQKFSFGGGTIEMHTAGANSPGDPGQNPATLHDGGANVPPSVVILGNSGKQLRVDTPLAGRITNPA
jgi:hypothetical protein